MRLSAVTAIAVFVVVMFGCLSPVAWAGAWDEGGGPRWDALMAAAKAEGGVEAAICSELSGPIERQFKADTGLDISFIRGNSQDLTMRMRAELSSGRVTVDVRTSGPSDLGFMRDGYQLDLKDNLILPNVTDPANWVGGGLEWADNAGRYMAMPAQYVSTRPMINQDIIDPASIKNWTDLMKPEFKGKIAAYDPTVVGPGQTFGAYLAKVHGIDFVTKLFEEQGVVISRDSRQLGEWVGRGVYPIALGMDALYLDRLREQGLTSLAWVTPDDGPGSLVGGCALLSIPKDAPHRNAAIVFANWYLSSNGQKAMEEAAHYPSRRTDIAHSDVADYFLPDPSKTYINQYKEDWYFNELVKFRTELKDRLQPLVGN